ncbi:MAG: hypothetical protein JXB07_11685 [Anaerolineae bacterium]|nr:hypothetical protein [Anaerolineae bacterium]
MKPPIRHWLVLGLAVALLILTGSMLLEQPDWCISPDGSPVGCAEVTLTPGEAIGDFYVDGALVAPARNIGQLALVPDVDHTIEIKNIQSTESNFGTLFNYADVSTIIRVQTGQTRAKTVKLVKNYIRGTLNFTCDVKGAAPTDVVACRVTIDGVIQPDVAVGQSIPYILDSGDRGILVEVVGDQASLFDPANKQQTVKIYAGRTATLKTTFTKKGHLFLALDQTNVVADFYVNKELVASQVAVFDMWLAPNKSHTVEAKNFVDTAAAGVYSWKDARLSAYLQSGLDKTITFKLQKKYLKGFLELTCNIKNHAGEDAYCNVAINEVPQGVIAAGQKATYTLDPGQHSVKVDLAGGNANLWAPASLTQKAYITAGSYPRKVSATFQKAGHLIVALDQAGVVGDFYVDGILIAAQVPSITQWVTPNASHKIEVKNTTDPAAPIAYPNGREYRWKDASTTAVVSAGQDKTVTVKLVKEITSGTLNVYCIIDGLSPGESAYCVVQIDGVMAGTVPANSGGSFSVMPGDHMLHIHMGPEWMWWSTPHDEIITISVNRVQNFTAYYYIY